MKKYLTLLALFCGVVAVNAQVITLGVSTQTSVTGCSVSIYDTGGLNGDYSAKMAT